MSHKWIKGSTLFKNPYCIWYEMEGRVIVINNGKIFEDIIGMNDKIIYTCNGKADLGLYDDDEQHIPLINAINPIESAKRISGGRDVRLIRARESGNTILFEYELI
jgi:hypothetical protein